MSGSNQFTWFFTVPGPSTEIWELEYFFTGNTSLGGGADATVANSLTHPDGTSSTYGPISYVPLTFVIASNTPDARLPSRLCVQGGSTFAVYYKITGNTGQTEIALTVQGRQCSF